MTKLLEEVVAAARALPDDEEDRVAHALMVALRDLNDFESFA